MPYMTTPNHKKQYFYHYLISVYILYTQHYPRDIADLSIVQLDYRKALPDITQEEKTYFKCYVIVSF